MKKNIFRWGLVLAMLLGLLTTGVMATGEETGDSTTETTTTHAHPLEDGETWVEVDDVADVGYTALGGKNLPAGHYVLTKNVNLGADYVRLGGDVTICLNGYTLSSTGTGTYRLIRAANNDLTVCDCSANGTGKMESKAATAGGYILTAVNGTITLDGGTVTGAGKFGVGIFGSAKAAASGKIVINGGKVTGITGSGGYAVGFTNYLADTGCTLTISEGSEISGPVAIKAGCSFNMTGGTITGTVTNAGDFTMSGGTISNNTTTENGGAVNNTGTFTMKAGATISGNTAAKGGAVYNEGTFTMEGGSITGNTAENGGAVYTSSGTFTMTGGTIGSSSNNDTDAQNVATTNGGGVYVAGGTVEITGGLIKNNKAGDSTSSGSTGVDMYISDGTVNQSGEISSVTNGRVRQVGGSLTISGGTTTQVYSSNGTASISGGKFITNGRIAGYLASDNIYTFYQHGGADYRVVKGLVPLGNGGEMNFGESLDLTLYYNYPTKVFGDDWNAETHLANLKANGVAVEVSDTVDGLAVAYSVPAASQMHKDITIDFTYDDTAVATAKTSVYELASAWYKEAAGDAENADDDDVKLQTLWASVVAYGNAAADAFKTGYTVENTLTAPTAGLADRWKRNEDYNIADAVHNMYATLSLKDQIELNIYHENATTGEFEKESVTGIKISEALNTRTVTFGDCCTVNFGIKDYILGVLEDGTSTQLELVKALQKYIDAVYTALGQ